MDAVGQLFRTEKSASRKQSANLVKCIGGLWLIEKQVAHDKRAFTD